MVASGRASGIKFCSNKLLMNSTKKKVILAQTSPRIKRSALSLMYPGGSDKYARGITLLRVATVNVGTMSKKYGELVEMCCRRRLDFCCLQETRWKGNDTRTFGRYKFFWAGCETGLAGVGVLVEESWVDKVLEVKRVSERLLVLRVQMGKTVLNLVSLYAPQVGRPMVEKEEFLICLREVLSAVATEEYLVVCGDMNAHVGDGSDGFKGIHGGYGYGERNKEGEMLLELAVALDLVIANTWFKKDEQKLITFDSGGSKTVIDYILVPKRNRKMVKNVTVMQGEQSLKQHKLLVGVFQLEECNFRKRRKIFVSKCKVWKLKDPELQKIFRAKVEDRLAKRVEEKGDGDVEMVWSGLKKSMLEVAEEVCGKTRGKQRHRETWWWNEDVAELIKEKRRLYKILSKSKMEVDLQKHIEDKKKYNDAKYAARRGVAMAKEVERKKFGEILDKESKKGMVFRVAKQIVRKNQDIVGSGCVKNSEGRIVVDEDKVLETWREYYARLSNEEFPWNKETLEVADAISGPCEKITTEEVQSAIMRMRCNKSAGPSGVVSDMLRAAGDVGTLWVTDLCNAVVKEGRIPKDWCKSWMINIYKGKGNALECGSYRGIRLLEHVMKILERVLETRVRKIVKIDDMQFGFMTGKGTTDAIFIVRQLQEKYLAKKKDLWMAFIDLEKAFDRVPRDVVWWALRTLGVDEWLVSVIRALYMDILTMVKINDKVSKGFGVKIGVHQGSVLSPLLFIIVLEAISRRFRESLPKELLYADDLVLMADSEEQLVEKIRKWKFGLEENGLRVNLNKTKVMRCRDGAGQVSKSGKYPCGVCGKGVSTNSIQCSHCHNWVHKRCSKIKGRIKEISDYKCGKCNERNTVGPDVLHQISLEENQYLECVEKFCYLGDMIAVGGGAEEASRARVRCAWVKFRELSPILTSRGASLKVKGQVYRACVQSVLIYGSETWPIKTEDMQRMERTERMMIRWMCGVTLKNRISSVELCRRLGVEEIGDVVRRCRLRWFGHLERKSRDDWISKCRDFDIAGPKCRGRGKKTWGECVRHDLQALNLGVECAQDRVEWRKCIRRNRPTHASMEKRTKR